jgi:hypothetical protein
MATLLPYFFKKEFYAAINSVVLPHVNEIFSVALKIMKRII